MDRNYLNIPLTPHAQYIKIMQGFRYITTDPSSELTAQGFFGVTGTSQGHTPSPSNWTATFGISFRALETSQSFSFLVRTETSLAKSQDVTFADDVYSFSARKEKLQEWAGILSATTAILGVSFATPKLLTTAKAWGQEPSGYQNKDYHLVVHDRDCTPINITVAYANNNSHDCSFRNLGVHMDINNTYTMQ